MSLLSNAVVKALGLEDKNVRSLVITFEADAPPIAEVEIVVDPFVNDKNELVTEFSYYKLVRDE